MSVTLEIISPDGAVFKGEVNSVTLPGVEGQFQVLANHAPLVTILEKDSLYIDTKEDLDTAIFAKEDNKYAYPINGGTVEVKNNTVLVLAQ